MAYDIMSGKYKIPLEARKVVQNAVSTRSYETLKKTLAEAGMKNADEFVSKARLQTDHIKAFFKKHPEIEKLNETERTNLFRALLK